MINVEVKSRTREKKMVSTHERKFHTKMAFHPVILTKCLHVMTSLKCTPHYSIDLFSAYHIIQKYLLMVARHYFFTLCSKLLRK